jgi:hypothetical protein
LAEKAFQDLRKAYVRHIGEVMAKSDFAQARSNIAIARWRKCVTEKAAGWSRLQDDASTVGKAAVTACETMWPSVQRVLGYVYQSKGLSPSGASDVSGSLHDTMKDVATETVISERAKRLPKR